MLVEGLVEFNVRYVTHWLLYTIRFNVYQYCYALQF